MKKIIYAYSRENTRQIIIEKLLTIGWGGASHMEDAALVCKVY